MQNKGLGILLPVGTIGGLAVGLAIGEPSLGTVVGFGLAAVIALGAVVLRR